VTLEVRPLAVGERPWVSETLRERWGSDIVIGHGAIHRPAELDGFVASDAGERVGLITYARDGDALEIVTIDAFAPRRGIGRALVGAVAALDAKRVWLITTNDNVDAQRFYEAVGFRLVQVHEGAVARSRELKPEIPRVGHGGVAITDELEYELVGDRPHDA
jgi:ribosomal protein S18 acetylase RimI-like enzyme